MQDKGHRGPGFKNTVLWSKITLLQVKAQKFEILSKSTVLSTKWSYIYKNKVLIVLSQCYIIIQ